MFESDKSLAHATARADEDCTTSDEARQRDAMAIAKTLEQLVRLQFARSFVDGLRPAQWHALRYFALAPRNERTVTAFARHRGSTMGTASTTVSTLVRKKYLGRTEKTRNSGLYVTEAGYALLENDPINDLVSAIGRLDTKAHAILREALPWLVETLTQQGPAPAD